MIKKLGAISLLIISTLLLSGCTTTPTQSTSNITPNTKSPPETTLSLSPTHSPSAEQKTDSSAEKDKVCSWVDKSDIIIELTFAEGVTLDTSYETGFYYSPIISNMRLARKQCDYRTGFSFSELKDKGAVQVGVRGYTDNVRRQLADEPINVIFDSEGKPNITTPIKVRVIN